jgi:hypothetical protein
MKSIVYFIPIKLIVNDNIKVHRCGYVPLGKPPACRETIMYPSLFPAERQAVAFFFHQPAALSLLFFCFLLLADTSV